MLQWGCGRKAVENTSHLVDWAGAVMASMGCGRTAAENHLIVLQVFELALASMGLRPESRRKLHRPYSACPACAAFNWAAAGKPQKTSCLGCATCSARTCFNGAAAGKPQKTRGSEAVALLVSAASMGLRPESRRKRGRLERSGPALPPFNRAAA
jgi:hypothetical protein